MKKTLLIILAGIMLAVLVGCTQSATPSPTQTPTPTSKPATTAPAVTPTGTSTPTAIAKPTSTPTATTPAKVIKWKMNSWQTVTNVMSASFKEFAEDVKKRTGGQLEITVYPAGELPYKPQEALRTVRDGYVEIAEASFAYTSSDAPILALLNMPLISVTKEETVQNLEIADPYIKRALDKFKAEPLMYLIQPPTYIFTKNKITTLADFKGIKMRSFDTESAELVKRMGATPISVITAELYTALQRGLIEGTFNSALNVMANQLFEVVKYGWMLKVFVPPNMVTISKDALATLPPNVAKTLKEVGAEWGIKVGDKALEADTAYMKDLINKGIVFTEPLAKDIETLKKMMVEVQNDWAKRTGPEAQELLTKILKAKGL